MESFFARFKNALVLILILLAQTIGLAIQVRRPVSSTEPDGRRVYLLRSWAAAIVSPFERLFAGTGAAVKGAWMNYVDLRHTRQQNQQLRQEIAQLKLEQAAFSEDAMQGQRLQALLGFQQHYVAKTVAAQVIGTSGSDLSRILLLDKGSADGLKPDMPVITPDGVVGKLRDVFPHSAQLLLLSDPTAGAGVLLSSTRIRAIVHGTATGKLEITNLTPDSRIKTGEQIITSGGDMVYPRGLAVGTIASIAPDPDHQPFTAITIKPAANLSQLEEVLVITQTETQLSPAAKQDLAQGVATAGAIDAQAAESARAADVLAQRLPSLHDLDPTAPDPNAPVVTNPNDPNAGGTVPKPLPTLHPDRYTPGTTPPAADLTPGVRSNTLETPGATTAPEHRRPRTSNPTEEPQP